MSTFHLGKLNIKENNKNKLKNPNYVLHCHNYKCKKTIALLKFSFFRLNHKYPISVICFIIYQFLILKLNAMQIKEAIKTKYKKSTNLKTIYSILSNIRKIIGNYLKHKYR